LFGCSLHPIEGDVWRKSTLDIVERIRCEAKEGLGNFRGNKHEERIVETAKIAYDFQFDVEGYYEAGSGKAEFRGAPFTLDLSASLRNDRNSGKNRRDFLIIEDLEELSKAVCPKDKTPANWVYPITGAIGMDEIVRTYIQLEKLTDLEPGGTRTGLVKVKGGDSDVFADELVFTTEWNVGATATIELNTIAGSFRLSKVAPFGNARRKDVHSVTIALARDPGDDPDLPAAGLPSPSGERPRPAADRPGSPEKGKAVSRAKRERLYIAENENAKRQLAFKDSKRVAKLVLRDATPGNRVVLELLRRRNLRDDARVTARVLLGQP
jgi:hypothetical protein